MSTQDTEDLQGRVGPFLTYVERVRPDGVVARWDSRRPPQAPEGRLDRRLDLVGAQGPGMVDRGPVRRGVAAVRPRRGSRLRQRRRGPLGRGDVLHRLAVLHRGRVPDLPGGGRRRPAYAGLRPSALLRLPAPPDRLVGHRHPAGRDPVVQHQHRERATGRPVRAGRAPAHMAARRHRLDSLPSRQRAGLVRGLPRLGRLASPVLVLVDHAGSTWSGPSRSACPPWPATSTRPPARSTTPNGPTWAPWSARSASSWAPCCCCQNAREDSAVPAPVATPGAGHT